jgi:hypothetical protein
MEVELTKYETLWAATVGIRRRIVEMHKADSHRDRLDKEGFNQWAVDIEAACAEMAYAKSRDVYWDGSVNTFKAPDVGDVQIRHSIRPDAHLIIRPKDNADEIYCLVTGQSPHFTIHGWIKGWEAQNKDYERYQDGEHPCWYVPQDKLYQWSLI